MARITHVADVFDVLVHERPYKDSWSVEAAAEEIRKGAGTQFDPAVVEAFDALGPARLAVGGPAGLSARGASEWDDPSRPRRREFLMESSTPTRVLVVANRTAATPALLDAVRERAARGPCAFTLLVPHTSTACTGWSTPRTRARARPRTTLELALPLLEKAAGGPSRASSATPSRWPRSRTPSTSQGFDEIILSTLPKRFSRWLKLDLPHKAAGLGLPVTTVTAEGREGAAYLSEACPRSGSGCRC